MTVTTRPPRSKPSVVVPDVAAPVRAPAAGEVVVGRARAFPTRREGPAKLTGTALYTDDLVFPGAWYGHTIRSTEAHARLLGIDLDEAFDWSKVIVLTARDIPGDNLVSLIADDQPVLVEDEIRHHAEPVALLAAPDRETLRAAKERIRCAPSRCPLSSIRWSRSRSSRTSRSTRATRRPGLPRPNSSSRASTAWATRSSSISRTRR